MSQIHTGPAKVPLHERPQADENILTDKFIFRQLNKYIPFPSSQSERNYEGSGWQIPHPLASMADLKRRAIYDVPPSRLGDVYQTHPETSQRPPREQLPPLSSIFAPSRPGVPSRAPYADRSPTFPTVTPQHVRQAAAQTPQEQHPWDPVYSQRHQSQPVSSHNSYDARPAPSTNSELPPLPRPMQGSQPPNSPRFYDSRYNAKDGSLTQLPSSRGGWSPRSEAPYREYFPATSRDTSSSFQPQLDQHHPAPQLSQRKESENGVVYKDAPHSISSTQHYAPTTSNTAVSDPVTTKDGLGPKIWTGTQFLPRFVRQAEVPGEGLCYFYDDGTHCKTHIDGEAVNAHWGVTKAGKPRKRLAIACITCREKKIKCDPDYPRCTQCEKFGRVCKFKNAPRGGQGSPEMSPADADDILLRPVSQLSDSESSKLEKRDFAHSFSLQKNHRQSSPGPDENPAKRVKYSGFTPVQGGNGQILHSSNASPEQRTMSMSRRPSHDIVMQWANNPFDTDGELTIELIRIYFIHIGSGTHYMFPERQFMLWLTNRYAPKSPDDLMLIYTMLALATVFSSNPDHKEHGKEFAAISRYACDQRHYSLQLVQSRLLLALYYDANNNSGDSWDFCGGALRAAMRMKLYHEIEKTDENDAAGFPYGLNRNGYAECRRRTFWSCYIMDRFSGFCSGHLSMIQSEDVCLRLPCDIQSFEEQIEVDNPYFDLSAPVQNRLGTIGYMAYLVNICSIWGDVMAHAYRSSQRPEGAEEDGATFMAFHTATTHRLEAWRSSLPDGISYSPENLIKSVNCGILDIFITMHSLYHSAHMKLNRHVRLDRISSEQLEHNIRAAHSHAEALLLMAGKLATRPASQSTSNLVSKGVVASFSSPFIGYAIVSAIDILSAKGHLSSLQFFPAKIRGAMAVIAELASFWQSAKNQKDMLAARNADLVAGPAGWKGFFGARSYVAVNRDKDGHGDGDGGKEGDGGGPRPGLKKQETEPGTFVMKVAIEKTFARDNDCVYAVGMDVWDKALQKKDAKLFV